MPRGVTTSSLICVESTIVYVPLNSLTICAPVFLLGGKFFRLKVPSFWSASVSPLSALQEPVSALALWWEQLMRTDAAKMAANLMVWVYVFINANCA